VTALDLRLYDPFLFGFEFDRHRCTHSGPLGALHYMISRVGYSLFNKGVGLLTCHEGEANGHKSSDRAYPAKGVHISFFGTLAKGQEGEDVAVGSALEDDGSGGQCKGEWRKK
jgi:hypothetical protein